MGKAGREEIFSDQFVELIVRGRCRRDRRWAWVGLRCGCSAGRQEEMGWRVGVTSKAGAAYQPTLSPALNPAQCERQAV